LGPRYAGLSCEYFIRNRQFLKSWEPERANSFYTVKGQKRFLMKDYEDMISGRMIKVWLFEKDEKPGKIVGSITLDNIIRGYFLSCLLSYRLDKHKVNKGYMTEALVPMIDFAFNDLGLHRIEANIMPHNIPSLKVVKKLGFKPEGLAQKYLKINGKWQDHVRMVLLNEAVE